jgi:hypothetical protein
MKLTKKQEKELSAHTGAVDSAFQDMDKACNDYNEATTDGKEEARKDVQHAVDTYNAAVASAEEFCQEIHDLIDEFIGEKSEGWQEGEKGEAHSSWKDHWEEVKDQLQPITIDELDLGEQMSIESIDNLSETMAELPSEPEC